MLQHEQATTSLVLRGVKAVAGDSAAVAGAVLDGLDGLGKVVKRGVFEVSAPAVDRARKRAAAADRLRQHDILLYHAISCHDIPTYATLIHIVVYHVVSRRSVLGVFFADAGIAGSGSATRASCASCRPRG